MSPMKNASIKRLIFSVSILSIAVSGCAGHYALVYFKNDSNKTDTQLLGWDIAIEMEHYYDHKLYPLTSSPPVTPVAFDIAVEARQKDGLNRSLLRIDSLSIWLPTIDKDRSQSIYRSTVGTGKWRELLHGLWGPVFVSLNQRELICRVFFSQFWPETDEIKQIVVEYTLKSSDEKHPIIFVSTSN